MNDGELGSHLNGTGGIVRFDCQAYVPSEHRVFTGTVTVPVNKGQGEPLCARRYGHSPTPGWSMGRNPRQRPIRVKDPPRVRRVPRSVTSHAKSVVRAVGNPDR